MMLDATTPVAYPDRETRGKFYGKFRQPLVDSPGRSGSYADCEDAFHKPMRLKDLEVHIRQMSWESAKSVAAGLGIASDNVDQIKYRMGNLPRKHGPRCFKRVPMAESRTSGLGPAA